MGAVKASQAELNGVSDLRVQIVPSLKGYIQSFAECFTTTQALIVVIVESVTADQELPTTGTSLRTAQGVGSGNATSVQYDFCYFIRSSNRKRITLQGVRVPPAQSRSVKTFHTERDSGAGCRNLEVRRELAIAEVKSTSLRQQVRYVDDNKVYTLRKATIKGDY